MALGLPSINIAFKQAGTSAIKRGKRGTVALILRDTTSLGGKTVLDITDVEETLSQSNRDYIALALLGNTSAPYKVETYTLGTDGELEEALTYFENVEFDYIAIPSIEESEKKVVEGWIKTSRDTNKKMVKAVLPKSDSDCEGVINFTTETVTTEEKTYSCAEFTARIAGLLAGTDLRVSTTFTNVPEVIDIPKLQLSETETKIGQGELVLFREGGKIKIARGVTSLTTVSEAKGDLLQKIKIVDTLDMIYTDIRLTVRENYIGKYANSYDNKCLLISAIQAYFEKLEFDGILDKKKSKVEIDIEAQTIYLKSIGVDVSNMEVQDIKEANTKDKVFLKANIKVLDAIENIDLNIEV